jgi:hypothetical protein
MKKWMVSLTLGLVLTAAHAYAADTSCYKFEVTDSPEMAASITHSHLETWCYKQLAQPMGAYFVYNADEAKVRPEMSFVIEADGMMTHSSLAAGKLTNHRVNVHEFNPFPVPAFPPHAMMSTAVGEVDGVSAENVLRLLDEEPSTESTLAIQEGDSAAAVPAERLPFRGYWWPYHNAPLYGSSSSPLAKYDRYVSARTGSNPGARSWESSHHAYRDISWEGHCNGWAASAILRAEPKASHRDSTSGVTFSVSDMKGIVAEKDYCANVAFFGKRYNGRRGDDIRDIYPQVLHRVITYYVGQLGKPVAVDHHRDPSVDNHIISAYKMSIVKVNDTRFKVTMVATIHKYDGSRSNTPGVAPTYTQTYKYYLDTDASGNVTGGSWISTNPDFLWVPLSPTSCGSNNPRLSENYVEAILNLPDAE